METPIASSRSRGTDLVGLTACLFMMMKMVLAKKLCIVCTVLRVQDLIHEFQYFQSSQKHLCCKCCAMGVHYVLSFGRKHLEYMIIYRVFHDLGHNCRR